MRLKPKISIQVLGLLLLFQSFGIQAQNIELITEIRRSINSSENLNQKIELLDSIIYEFENNDSDSALYYSQLFLEACKESKDWANIAYAHSVLGVSYDNVGEYDFALFHYSESSKSLDSIKGEDIRARKAHIMHNMGLVKQEIREYDEAENLMKSALEFYSTMEDSTEMITSLNALGSFFWEMQEYDSAIIYLKAASNLVRKHFPKEIDWIAYIDFETVYTYAEKGEIEKAKELYNDLAQPEKMQYYSKYTKAGLVYCEGIIAGAEGNYEQAFQKLEQTLEFANSIGLGEEIVNIYKALLRISEEAEDWKRAHGYSRILLEKERGWLDARKVSYTKFQEVQFGTKEKENKIVLQEASIKDRNRIIGLISFLGLIILFLAILQYRNYKKIESKNKRVEALIRELHHRVKNNLQIISSLLSMQSMRMEEGEAKEAVDEGRSRIKAMSMIHQQLYMGENTAEVNSEEYLLRLLEDLKNSFGSGQEQLLTDIRARNLDVDTILPVGLIVNELVSNAFKYAFKDVDDPQLKVSFDIEDKFALLKIKDNGKGLPEDFDLASANSFGLKLVNILVKQLKGTMDINKEEGLEYQLKFQLKKAA